MTVKTEDVTIMLLPVPIPFTHPNGMGVNSTKHHTAVRLMQRYNGEQSKLIHEQAARLGITPAVFIKETAYAMAKALAEQEKEHERRKNDRSG